MTGIAPLIDVPPPDHERYDRRNEVEFRRGIMDWARTVQPLTATPLAQAKFTPNVYNVLGYGARGDGVTDDTAAIRAVMVLAGPTAGKVFFPPGTYLISSTLSITDQISLEGVEGASILKATGTAFGPMTQIYETSAFGNRYGSCTGLVFNGNGIATVGLSLGVCVARTFADLLIQNCTQVGLRLLGTQNCDFVNLTIISNASANGTFDCNMLFDMGPATNTFIRCQFASPSGKYNILLRRTGAAYAGLEMTDNVFFNCNIEGWSANLLAQVYQRAGTNTRFVACAFSTTEALSGTPAIYLADTADAGSANRHVHFESSTFEGIIARSRMMTLTGVAPVVLTNCFFEGFAVVFTLDDTSMVITGQPLHAGAYTTFLTATGSKTEPGLIVQESRTFGGTPSNTTGIPLGISNCAPWFFDTTNNVIWFYSSGWKGIQVAATLGTFPGPLVVTAGNITANAGDIVTAAGAIVAERTSGTQLWAKYDVSNYMNISVASTGATTYDAVGSGALHTFVDPVVAPYYRNLISSPAQITSNQNDYNPGAFGWLRLSTDASRDITGFTGGVEGRELLLTNVGAFNIVLVEQATSTAANQIITGTGANVTMVPLDNALVKYDSTSSRWRIVSFY